MKVVVFQYSGRFGHFLRAEATANALTYPTPPRTVLLGLCGCILGLPKDTSQDELAEANFAVCGALPKRFWHKANMRKNLPTPLGYRVKKKEKGTSKDEKNTRIPQEFLWRPTFRIFAALPKPHHDDFANRLKDRRWHFTPCLGLSELLAELELLMETDATLLANDDFKINSIVALNRDVKMDTQGANGLAIQKIRMPRDVTSDRVFTHVNYLMERDGKPIPVKTSEAWQVESEKVVFL